MTIEEYVLTYPDENGNPLINIADYFERYVKPLSPKFSTSSFYEHRTVVCPFHEDTDPSLGTINHRHLKGVRVYHCFGCGASGTVIRMHQRIQYSYHGKRMTDVEAAIDLCKLYGVDTTPLVTRQYTANQLVRMRKLDRLRALENAYGLRDFAEDLMPVREDTYTSDKMLDMDLINQRAEKINKAVIRYMAEKKGIL